MVANRYQQAAERLRRASRLGQRRVATPRQPDTILAPPPNRPADPPVPSENAVPHDAARQGPYHPYQHPSQYRPSPVKLGFGLGLGFAAGGAVFRLIVFLIGVGLLFMLLQTGLAIIGF